MSAKGRVFERPIFWRLPCSGSKCSAFGVVRLKARLRSQRLAAEMIEILAREQSPKTEISMSSGGRCGSGCSWCMTLKTILSRWRFL